MTMQLRGGRGYEKARSLKARGEVPYPVERIMRDCRINLILEGSTEIMKLFLAREAIDPHLKKTSVLLSKKSSLAQKGKSFVKVLAFYAKWYSMHWMRENKRTTYKGLGKLENHFQYIEKSAHLSARKIFHAIAKYRHHLEKKQLLLGRLVEISTELFAMAAVCSYAQHLRAATGDASPIQLADYFCHLSRRKVNQLFNSLDANDDPIANTIAEQTLEGHFKWLEKGVLWIGPE